MTIYLAPCGLSILDNLRSGRGCPPGATVDGAFTAVDVLLAWAGGFAAGDTPAAVADGFRVAFSGVADRLCLAEWPAALAAETATLAARTNVSENLDRCLERGDTVVLLASQTDDGILAALLVAAYMAREDIDRIRVAATPSRLPRPEDPSTPVAYPLEPGSVTVVRIGHLSARVGDGFRKATFGIGSVLRAALEMAAAQAAASSGRAIEVHLTGGHKATLLQTMALAEVLRSNAASEKVAVTAWYLFEDNARDPSATATEIGLRLFSQGTLTGMRDELNRVLAKRAIPTTMLEGVAWTRASGVAELTAFGWGYRALLGAPRPRTEGSDA